MSSEIYLIKFELAFLFQILWLLHTFYIELIKNIKYLKILNLIEIVGLIFSNIDNCDGYPSYCQKKEYCNNIEKDCSLGPSPCQDGYRNFSKCQDGKFEN